MTIVNFSTKAEDYAEAMNKPVRDGNGMIKGKIVEIRQASSEYYQNPVVEFITDQGFEFSMFRIERISASVWIG